MLQQAFGSSAASSTKHRAGIARWPPTRAPQDGVARPSRGRSRAPPTPNAERERRAAGHEARRRGDSIREDTITSCGLGAVRPLALAPSRHGGRETYGSAVRVPTDRAPITNPTPSGLVCLSWRSRSSRRPPRPGRPSRPPRRPFFSATSFVVRRDDRTDRLEQFRNRRRRRLFCRGGLLVSRLEGKTKTRASPYDDAGRGFGAPSPRPPAVGDPSPRGSAEPKRRSLPDEREPPREAVHVATARLGAGARRSQHGLECAQS